MESERANPRRQLEVYDEAVRVSVAHAWQPAPGWLFPLLALAGPAIVAWSAANGESTADGTSVLRVVSIVFWVVAVGAVLLAGYLERANATVRPKPPIKGGRSTVWMFLAIFALLLGFTLTRSLSSVVDHWLLAIGSYLWLAVVPRVLFARHGKEVTKP